MISEQIRKLRSYAETAERAGFLSDFVNAIKGAADTIEELSEKLARANMERSAAYYNDGWIPVSSGKLPKRGEIISATILIESQQRRFVSQIMYDDSWLDNDWKMIAWKPLDEPYKGE